MITRSREVEAAHRTGAESYGHAGSHREGRQSASRAPPEEMSVPATEWSPTARLSRIDFVARDAASRDLGRRGEEFVLEFEGRRLHDAGHRELARRIEWTAQVRGDGQGMTSDRSTRTARHG